MSVLWASKYAKIRFPPGLGPDHGGGARRSPDTLVGWWGDTYPLHSVHRMFGASIRGKLSPKFYSLELRHFVEIPIFQTAWKNDFKIITKL